MTDRKELARKAVRLLLRRVPKKKDSLIATGEFVALLADLYRRSKEVRNFLVSPFVERKAKLAFLSSLAKKLKVPSEAMEVFEYLLDINGFSLLSDIRRIYDHEIEKLMKTTKGTLYLATDLGRDTKKIVSAIEKAVGLELEVDVKVDESLIGGFLFKTHGMVIDASVRRQLDRLTLLGG